MFNSKKETAWRKNRKFGDVIGGRTFPKITDNILAKYHSLEAPIQNDELPIFIRDNPSRDFYFPVNEIEILGKLNQLPSKYRNGITHIWLKKVKKISKKELGFQGLFICGSGVNLIILEAFPKNLRMIFGNRKPQKKELKIYSQWCEHLVFDETLNIWYLQWQEEQIRDYYLQHLLLHEIGHFFESQYKRFFSKASSQKSENFANTFARIWDLKTKEMLSD